MKPPRFSIAGLLVLILTCAVALAALHSPSPLWANAIFSLAVLMQTIALIGIVNRRGPKRAFWSGFALSGWLYLILSCGPSWIENQYSGYLFTTALLHILEPQIMPEAPQTYTVTFGPGTAKAPRYYEARKTKAGAGNVGGMMGFGVAPTPHPLPSRWAQWSTVDQSRSRWKQSGSVRFSSPDSYMRIGHSLFTLLFATLGGLIGYSFLATNPREEPTGTRSAGAELPGGAGERH